MIYTNFLRFFLTAHIPLEKIKYVLCFAHILIHFFLNFTFISVSSKLFAIPEYSIDKLSKALSWNIT